MRREQVRTNISILQHSSKGGTPLFTLSVPPWGEAGGAARGPQEGSGGMLIIKVFDPILDLSGLLGENLGAGRGSPGERRGLPPGAQDAEECLHLLSPHFADLHVMSFRIRCLCAVSYQVIRAENDAKACIRRC